MPNSQQIILNGQVETDQWQLLTIDEGGELEPSISGDIIVPVHLWLEQPEQFAAHSGQVGVWFDSHEEPESLGQAVNQLPLVAIRFPIFTDGRGYSIARLLRERYGYQGDIRAFGDVTQDQLFYMRRCGFTSFVLKEGKSIEDALNSLAPFSECYQGAVVEPQPLFRRRS